MMDHGGKILHKLSRCVAFSCRFRRCSDHGIARHGYSRFILDEKSERRKATIDSKKNKRTKENRLDEAFREIFGSVVALSRVL